MTEKWNWTDAVYLALQINNDNPDEFPDTDALATDLWREMQEDNTAKV